GLRSEPMRIHCSIALSSVLACSACASAPQIVPGAFPSGAKIAVGEYQARLSSVEAIDLAESYDTFRRELTDCGRAEIVDGDADVLVGVEVDSRLVQGTKAEGKDTAKVAVTAKVSGFDRHGVLVWADDVAVYSQRFSTNGPYSTRMRAAMGPAVDHAAWSLV